MAQEKILFFQERFGGFATKGSLNPLIGHGGDPGEKRGIQMIEGLKDFTAEESLVILDPRLDLSFGLSTVGVMDPRTKPIVPTEIPEGRVQMDISPLEITGNDHRPGLVIENLMGQGAKMLESLLAALEEIGQSLIRGSPGKHPSAIAQGHDKKCES